MTHLPLRERLSGRSPVCGLMIGFPTPGLVELAAVGGFDLVIIDTEHGSIGVESTEHLVRAAQSFGLHTLVRIAANDRASIQRAMDAGADGIQVPMVESAADAERAVSLARYAPEGTRGLAANRGARYAAMTADVAAAANERATVVLQIETAQGVAVAKEIAAVDGVDAVFVGPSDLSQSVGHLGDIGAAPVQEAISAALDAALPAVPCGILVRSPDDARSRTADGFTLLETAANALILHTFREFTQGVGTS